MTALLTSQNSITTLILACVALFAYWLYIKVQEMKANRTLTLEQKKARVKELQKAVVKWQKIKSDNQREKRKLPRGRVRMPAIN